MQDWLAMIREATHQMKADDVDRLNQLQHVKVTLLFTYSGIDNKDIEPYPSSVAAESLKLMSEPPGRSYRTVLYWQPGHLRLGQSGCVSGDPYARPDVVSVP
jgi:hypothetical protein